MSRDFNVWSRNNVPRVRSIRSMMFTYRAGCAVHSGEAQLGRRGIVGDSFEKWVIVRLVVFLLGFGAKTLPVLGN